MNASARHAVCFAAALAVAPVATAQSERASEASLAAISAVPDAALELVAAGARFSVTAVRPIGASVQLTLTAVGEGTSFVVQVSADTVVAAGLGVGAVVESVAVSTGHLLLAGGRALAYVPNRRVAELIHHSALSP
jgi:hypothetical protein